VPLPHTFAASTRTSAPRPAHARAEPRHRHPHFSNRRSRCYSSANFRRSSCRAIACLLRYGMNNVDPRGYLGHQDYAVGVHPEPSYPLV